MTGWDERFWSKVSKSRSCWEWQGIRSQPPNLPYGRFRVGNRMRQAHRVAWELTNGPIPENMFVLHKCDNPPCVNPRHLKLGTHVDNMVDMVQRGRNKNVIADARKSKTHCPQNHPYSGENLYIEPKTGRRHCKACNRTHAMESYYRKVR